jgi:hypothetical protein
MAAAARAASANIPSTSVEIAEHDRCVPEDALAS